MDGDWRFFLKTRLSGKHKGSKYGASAATRLSENSSGLQGYGLYKIAKHEDGLCSPCVGFRGSGCVTVYNPIGESRVWAIKG